MKIIITTLFLFIITTFCAFAQIECKYNDTTIFRLTEHVLYEFATYPLTIHTDDTLTNFVVEGDENAIIFSDNDSTLKVIFQGEQGLATISLYTLENNKKIKVFSNQFSFKPMPFIPVLDRRNYWQDGVPKEKLRQSTLTTIIHNVSYLYFPVTSFSILIYENGAFQKYSIVGDKIDETLHECIDNLKSGQPVIFDDVMMKSFDGRFTKKTGPMFIIIE